MSFQEILTFLFEAIALSFIAIAAIDLGREIVALYKQVFITPQLSSPERQPQPLPQLPDPWLLPAAETVAPAQMTKVEPKPLLLLAPASSVEELQSPGREVKIEELLVGVDVDTLQLRQARKLAKLLGIAQKVNGRDQKLDWLRAQIQVKLQQETVLQPEAIAVARGELIAC